MLEVYMVFNTKYERMPISVEKMSPVDKVCREGVLSAKRQIESLLMAGKQLIASRANEFDFSETDEVDKMPVPEFREQELDKLDALQVGVNLKVKLDTPVIPDDEQDFNPEEPEVKEEKPAEDKPE